MSPGGPVQLVALVLSERLTTRPPLENRTSPGRGHPPARNASHAERHQRLAWPRCYEGLASSSSRSFVITLIRDSRARAQAASSISPKPARMSRNSCVSAECPSTASQHLHLGKGPSIAGEREREADQLGAPIRCACVSAPRVLLRIPLIDQWSSRRREGCGQGSRRPCAL